MKILSAFRFRFYVLALVWVFLLFVGAHVAEATCIVMDTTDVSTAYNHSGGFCNAKVHPNNYAFAALEADGSIIAWGSAAAGGSGAPADNGYTKIYTVAEAFAAMKADGSITAWGNSQWGGSGAPTDSGYMNISSTYRAFAALKNDGTIVAWGGAVYGGSGAPTDSGYAEIYSTNRAFAALKADGSITSWGEYSSGAPTDNGYVHIYTNSYSFAAVKADGSITTWGASGYGVSGTPTDSGYTKIYSTQTAFAALKDDGTITAWGQAGYGGTGAPTDSGYVEIYPSWLGFAALKDDGSITSWGAYSSGVPTDSGYVRVYVTERAFAALKEDGSIAAWGDGGFGGSGAPTDSDYIRIYSTNSAFAALKEDGSITVWGDTGAGGTGAPSDNGYTHIHSTNNAFVAMKPGGAMTAWGSSQYGGTGAPAGFGHTVPYGQQCGPPNTIHEACELTDSADYNTARNIYGGFMHAPSTPHFFAFSSLKSNGSVFSWGSYSAGAPSGTGYGQVYSTFGAFAAFESDGSITTWGRSNWGGAGGPTDNGYIKLTSSGRAFAALKNDGSITAWGSAGYGGAGAPTDNGYTKIYSTQYAFAAMKPDGSIVSWGVNSSGAPIDSGYIDIYTTSGAFAAMKSDGSIVVWGDPSHGGSGAPTDNGYVRIYSTPRAFAALKEDGSIVAWGNANHGGTGAPTDNGYTQIFPAQQSFVAMKSGGSLTAWGDPASGGSGAPTDSGYVQVFSTGGAIAALKSDGTITAWGSATGGGTGAPTDGGYVQIYSSSAAFAALKNDGTITAWGDGSAGGTGAPTGNGYRNIYSTFGAFAALKADGSITAWGNPNQGGVNGPIDDDWHIPYGMQCEFDGNNPPTDVILSPDTIDENVAAGTTVGTLSTVDPDVGDTHNYSFTTGCANGGSDNSAFTINGDQLSINDAPDYESQNVYNLCVTTDDGTDAYEGELQVIVNDLNAAPTDIALTNDTIEEKQVVGTTIGDLSVTDDGEQNPEGYTYTLNCATPGADDAHFTINGNALQSATVFDFDNPVDANSDNDYEICIRVTEDNGGLSYDENFTITVTDDGNNLPTDITLAPDNVDENVAPNTTVGALTTTDPDTGDTHTYSFTTGCANGGSDNSAFTINGDQLSINDAPDYESQNVYNLCVTTDDGTDAYEGELQVIVNDLNAAPTDIALTSNQIEEKQAVGTAVGDLSVTDDGEQNPETYTYALNCATPGADDSHFAISGNSLQSAAVFDYDNPVDVNTDNDYEICVRVTEDNGGLTYDENFTITVTDDGNNPPTDITLAPSDVDENVADNTTVGTLATADPDTGDTHTYSFTTGCANGGSDNSAFTINGDQLSINDAPDYEAQNVYNLCVTTDDGTDTYEGELQVTVNDLNTAPTDITLTSNQIEEKQAVGTAVGDLSVTDDGEQNPEGYTYSISCATPGADDAHFTINGNALQSAAVFDYDNPVDANTDNDYEICIRVTEDNGGLSYDENFTITVTDDGNNPPTDITLAPDNVDENVAPNTTVGALTTTDPDTGDTHTYSFTTGCANGGSDNSAFTITGDQLSINSSPDYETKNSYALCITTSDGADAYEKEIAVTVNDLNAAPTNIALSQNTIQEGQAVGTTIGSLTTTDDGEQNPESYTYTPCATPGPDQAHFTITGDAIQANTVFDYDNPVDANTDNSYEICVTTTETNGGLTHDQNLLITIIDDNSSPPTDITLAPDTIDENVPPNTTVGTLTTTDPNTSDTHVYTFITACANGGADNNNFTITGDQLSINNSPDYEAQSSYSLCIETNDGQYTFAKEIIVTVNDIYEAQLPVISLNGDNPMTVTQNEAFNDPGATAYDPQEGDITEKIVTTGSVNTEIIGTYTITYTVTDNDGNTVSVQRTVHVEEKKGDDSELHRPHNLQAFCSQEDKTAFLTWKDRSHKEEGMKIQRKIDDGPWETIRKITSGNRKNYTDTDLEDGHTYYYRVRMYSKKDHTKWSNVASCEFERKYQAQEQEQEIQVDPEPMPSILQPQEPQEPQESQAMQEQESSIAEEQPQEECRNWHWGVWMALILIAALIIFFVTSPFAFLATLVVLTLWYFFDTCHESLWVPISAVTTSIIAKVAQIIYLKNKEKKTEGE